MTSLQIGHYVERSDIYGPGTRFVIWVQGCSLACQGCWNKQFWSSLGGKSISVSTLLDKIDQSGVDGVTILGGEPLQQSVGVLDLIKGCRDRGLHVFLYTGFTIEEFDKTMIDCFNLCDIVVSGRYVESLRDTSLRWRGSSNQKIHFPRSTNELINTENLTEVEIQIDSFGGLSVYGYPDESLLDVMS